MTQRSFARRLVVLVVLAFAASSLPATLIAAGNTPAPAGTYDVGGTVYAINTAGGYIMVETQKGCFQAVYPDANTSVTKNGLPARLASVAVGNRIRSSNSLTTYRALSIDLR